jgi:hypothetical protein
MITGVPNIDGDILKNFPYRKQRLVWTMKEVQDDK